MGKYPNFKGKVQVKQNGGFENIGESAVWVHSDSWITGQLKFKADSVEPDEKGMIVVRFNGSST